MSISADAFKQGMASWTSGVTIVTTRVGNDFLGMTVSDFGGVSMDPPLVLVCASKTSNTLAGIQQSRCFAVNVLAQGQDELSNRFASSKYESVRFEGLEVDSAKTGAPLLRDVVANFDCTLVAEHDGGDHMILVGQVEQVEVRDLEPLVYFRGGYRGITGGD